MSLNYARSLSEYENKGKLGLPEKFDDEKVVNEKCEILFELIKESKFCVVLTGAGISTAAGIPDFRGPNGVWTLEKTNKEAASVAFETARPTFAHFALSALEERGLIKFLITQNVDSLHTISGFPMNRLAELHGNVFTEKCSLCGRKYLRSTPIATIGLKPTGKNCNSAKVRGICRGKLFDTTLDWEDALPEPDYEISQLYTKEADLVLCLGTTLQIKPVGNIPLICKKNRGKLVIVNLQQTDLDKNADLIINAKLDDVFLRLTSLLGIKVQTEDVKAGDCEGLVSQSTHPLEIEYKKPGKTKKRKRNFEEL